MDDQYISKLGRKVDELIQLCVDLDKENRQLKAEAFDWQEEREQLIQKTDMAHKSVQTMIQRLKEMEQ